MKEDVILDWYLEKPEWPTFYGDAKRNKNVINQNKESHATETNQSDAGGQDRFLQ